MKYLKANFKNYIGFYNGMGLEELTIDFTKCINKIILITGANGTGKSTLLYSLNPFPDASTSFIPGKDAEKNLVLFNEGDYYEISIYSAADMKGGRKTTKAFIRKNGTELNENGNVSSYKDIIFSEFELDSNYISLSRLSATDRGLGDKTPSERKKFASGIIDNLETYNNIYKTLNKKSLIFKSNLNTLHTKILNIGKREDLNMRLDNLRTTESSLNKKIVEANNAIVAIQAKTSIDENEAKEIQDLNTEFNRITNILNTIEANLDTFEHKTHIKREDIKSKYDSDKELQINYTAKHNELAGYWREKSARLSDVSNNIMSIEAEINSSNMNDNISIDYKKSNDKIKEILDELNKLKIPADTSLIVELEKTLNFCEGFSEDIFIFNDGLEQKDIDAIVNRISNKYIADLITKQQSIIQEIENKKITLTDTQAKLKTLAILEMRPSKCKIDSCPFIKEAIDIAKSDNNVEEELSNIQNEIINLSNEVSKIQEEIDYSNSLLPKKMELDMIRRSIADNSKCLYMFYPDFVDMFLDLVLNMYTFGNIINHKEITNALNLLKMLESETQVNKVLEVEYKSFNEKVKLINSSKKMLDNLKAEQSELTKDISNLKSEIDEYKSMISTIASNIDIEEKYLAIYNNYLDNLSESNKIKDKLDIYSGKSAKAVEALSTINQYKEQIEIYSNQLNPVMQDISVISGQLTLLDSYYEEYEKYNKDYNMIETLKKYCSPTGGGIQTLFMQIYMSKTLDTANQILSMLFNGSYQLLNFIINESEFRIPFIGEGLPVDDISSGSSSQISMMSLIINLVLLHQASTKFNIAQLDEVDSSADSYNRSNFVNVLFHAIDILQIEQLFLISHSMEADSSVADIIRFKSYDDYESSIKSGNIIFDYDNVIK